MQIALTTSLPTPLSSLVSSPSARGEPLDSMPRQELEQVATQFEGVFMSLLIKELRESLETGMFAGENSDTYGALFDLYLGQHMAEAGGLGIKQMLVARYAEAGAGGAS
jgi:Rod binding domain-containing protein